MRDEGDGYMIIDADEEEDVEWILSGSSRVRCSRCCRWLTRRFRQWTSVLQCAVRRMVETWGSG